MTYPYQKSLKLTEIFELMLSLTMLRIPIIQLPGCVGGIMLLLLFLIDGIIEGSFRGKLAIYWQE